jgi:hypothetical protein
MKAFRVTDLMRVSLSSLLLLVLTQVPLFAAPKGDEPRCAFSDEPFMMMFTLTSCVTEYYTAHHSWPATTQQLRAQLSRAVATTLPIAAKPSQKDIDEFFTRFTQIELKPQNRDLLLSARYRCAAKSYSHRLLLHPGKNTDEMMQASTEVK